MTRKEENRIKLLLFAKSIEGGTGTAVLSLQKLSSSNFDITTVVLEKPNYRVYFRSTIKFFHSKNYYPNYYMLSMKYVIGFIHELIEYRNVYKKVNPEIVLSIDVHCNLIALIDKLFFFPKSKVIATTHIDLDGVLSSKGSWTLKLVLRKLITFFYNKASLIICLTGRMKEQMKNEFRIRSKMSVIGLGVSFQHKKTKIRHANTLVKKIISIGRLVEQKDFFVLVKAFAALSNRSDNVELEIIGEGPQKKELVKLAHRLGLKKSIKFLGWKQDVTPYLLGADIFVLSTKREGFPYSLLEAMTAGKPIISTDVKFGPSEILDRGKYGILTKVGDVEGLTESMYMLLHNKKKHEYYSKKSYERGLMFSEERMLSNYAKELKKVLLASK